MSSIIQTINSIDAVLSEQMRAKAWIWADKKFDGAWTKAHERLYAHLETTDIKLLQKELDFYRDTLIKLMKIYIAENKLSGMECFLKSIIKVERDHLETLTEEEQLDFPFALSFVDQFVFRKTELNQSGEPIVPEAHRTKVESEYLLWFWNTMKDLSEDACYADALSAALEKFHLSVLSFRETGKTHELTQATRQVFSELDNLKREKREIVCQEKKVA